MLILNLSFLLTLVLAAFIEVVYISFLIFIRLSLVGDKLPCLHEPYHKPLADLPAPVPSVGKSSWCCRNSIAPYLCQYSRRVVLQINFRRWIASLHQSKNRWNLSLCSMSAVINFSKIETALTKEISFTKDANSLLHSDLLLEFQTGHCETLVWL